jgi:ferric-dicitrate binding protein FerR (iron transport regulator)
MQIGEIYIGLIVRYLKNETSDKEKYQLFKWVYAGSSNEKYFYLLKDIWETAKYEQITANVETDTEWQKLALAAIKQETEHFSQKKTTKKLLWQAARIAAIVIITFGVGFFVQKFLPEEPVYSSVNVPYGAKTQVELPDGSKVWVNSGSTLKYPADLKGKKVDLFLEGEAFFDVTKDPKRKVNVRTSSINIQVLGTQFNVKSYNDEDVVETTLIKGSISITGRVGNRVIEKPILLKPREQATLIKSQGSLSLGQIGDKDKQPGQEKLAEHKTEIAERTSPVQPRLNISESVDIERFVSWKDDKLIFKNEPFESLAKRLERWYDVEISIKDDDLKCSRYTGSFEKETIEQAIRALSISLPFEYKIDKNQIEVIKKKS